jgi:dipeptidyl aminopeptidase/acylaminoacyl peptidase
VRGYVSTGTLAIVAEGRVPRAVAEDVQLADWHTDGTSLAIVREARGRTRVELPINTAIFETTGWISDLRFSPDGSRLAFVEHLTDADAEGHIVVIARNDPPQVVGGAWPSILGLAWSASGDELWFTAQDQNGVDALRAIDLHGRALVVTHAPGRLRLLDIAGSGDVLLARDDLRLEAHGAGPDGGVEHDLSWLDWSLARDITSDGKHLLITEYGEAVGVMPGIYWRPTDGSAAARLGTGSGIAFSPDGRSVLSIWDDRLSLLPVGAGDVRTLPQYGISLQPWAGFFPDGTRIVFAGTESGRASRVYVQDLEGGRPMAITPEGFHLPGPGAVSPRGDMVIVVGEDETLFLQSTTGGVPTPLAGALRGEVVARWTRDGDAVFVFHPSNIPTRVFRLSLDGRRQLERTLAPADRAGAVAIHRLVMTPAGDAYAYTLERQLTDLYVAIGLRGRDAPRLWR